MQLEQSRVGKTLESRFILPPMEASFSTIATEKSWSARLRAASSPAMPPPRIRASNRKLRREPILMGKPLEGENLVIRAGHLFHQYWHRGNDRALNQAILG